MAKYVPGHKYLRHADTKAVFPYRDQIAGLAKMETLVADENGKLIRPDQKPQSVEKLNPTRTPEKKAEPAKQAQAAGNKQPTLKPALPN